MTAAGDRAQTIHVTRSSQSNLRTLSGFSAIISLDARLAASGRRFSMPAKALH
jgi:hypothetical protein